MAVIDEDTKVLVARMDERLSSTATDVQDIKRNMTELVKTNQRITLVELDLISVKEAVRRAHDRIDDIESSKQATLRTLGVEITKVMLIGVLSAILAHYSIRMVGASELHHSEKSHDTATVH